MWNPQCCGGRARPTGQHRIDSQGRALLLHREVTLKPLHGTMTLGPPLGSRQPSGPNTTERTCSSVLGGHGASMGIGRQA